MIFNRCGRNAKMWATKRRKFIIILTLFVFLTILNLEDLKLNWKILRTDPVEILSCNYSESEDVLPSADTRKFPFKSIFFIETTCRGGLTVRQACAVESAARSHPDYKINVIFTAPATEQSLINISAFLLSFENLNFYRIHILKYAKGTPLEKFYAKRILGTSLWPMTHLSDVTRYLMLYKWGGIYLDLDTVVAKPLGPLGRNWAARESEESVSVGAMAFSMDAIGRRVAEDSLREIVRTYKCNSWGHNGPGVITRVLKRMCFTEDVTNMTATACNGFKVYGPEYFYPIKWTEANIYFETGHIDIESAHAFHVWNHVSQDLKIQKGSPYQTLAKKFCPTVYNEYMDD